MHRRLLLTAAFAALTLAACGKTAVAPKETSIAVDAKLTIARDSEGAFTFKYDAPFADPSGNFDFSKGEPYGKVVKLSFTIADDGELGLKFKPAGSDAIWIVDKKNVGPDGSPEGPYEGRQFRDFNVSADGKTLTLVDQNDDGVIYRYGLRFDLGSETVVDDPDLSNGQGGHTGGN